MKQFYVETSNHHRFIAGIAAVESRGSREACILLLTGEPGTGKSTTVDHWACQSDAVYLQGMPGMNVSFIRDYMADQTGVREKGKFAQYKALTEHFRATAKPIILDEAQHGLPNKAEAIEFLRRIAEQANVMLVLVCHTSEQQRFKEDKLAHISTRISDVTTLKTASVEDCALYLAELCEVGVDDSIAQTVQAQSRGRYRLLSNAVKSLEFLANRKGGGSLTAADVKGVKLCEDVMNPSAKEAK